MTSIKLASISLEEDALYSSADVAFICRVAPRTVHKWFDSKRLGGYTLPGSGTRRIPQADLKQFLQTHGMMCEWERFVSIPREPAESVPEDSLGFKGD